MVYLPKTAGKRELNNLTPTVYSHRRTCSLKRLKFMESSSNSSTVKIIAETRMTKLNDKFVLISEKFKTITVV